MKIISFHHALPYFFRQRIHSKDPGNVLAWVKPASESERNKRVVENILRWEDDGGAISETGYPLPQVAETNTPQLMDVAGRGLL